MNHTDALTRQVFTLIDNLYSAGMTEVVIAPGSRSTPLALAAEIHPRIKTYVHPDERSAAFFALGLSKEDKQPTGIICTSGTASANFTPAVAEADLSHVPLVVLTADRPAELRGVGAPQAIIQNNMYQNFVRYFEELPVADADMDSSFIIETKVRQAAVYTRGTSRGPVHFNIPIREPLMPDLSRTDLFVKDQVHKEEIQRPVDVQGIGGEILVILGETDAALSSQIPALDPDNVTVICDPRQHFRLRHPDVITTHDLLFQSMSDTQFEFLERHIDYIVRVGEPLTSKEANQFLKRTEIPQILISEYDDIKTFPAAPKEVYVGSIRETLNMLITSDDTNGAGEWLARKDRGIKTVISKEAGQFNDEGRYMHDITNQVSDRTALFLSSSMPIRDYERYQLNNIHEVFANRGANGIDGVVSTSIGMAAKRSMTLVIGDVALYHDMNGLIMPKLEGIDINIIVLNNNGGGIFSFLPQYGNREHFERLFGTPLDLDFRHTAGLYDFNYTLIESIDDLSYEVLNGAGRNIIEIRTDRRDNLEAHQSLKNIVTEWVKSDD